MKLEIEPEETKSIAELLLKMIEDKNRPDGVYPTKIDIETERTKSISDMVMNLKGAGLDAEQIKDIIVASLRY